MKNKSFENDWQELFGKNPEGQSGDQQDVEEDTLLTEALSRAPASFLQAGFPDRVMARVERREFIRDRFLRMGLLVMILMVFGLLVATGSLVLKVALLEKLTGLFISYLPYWLSVLLLAIFVQMADTLLLARMVHET